MKNKSSRIEDRNKGLWSLNLTRVTMTMQHFGIEMVLYYKYKTCS